jgi:hypothetical protein
MPLTAPCSLLTFSTTVGLTPSLALRTSRGLNPCSDVCSNSLCMCVCVCVCVCACVRVCVCTSKSAQILCVQQKGRRKGKELLRQVSSSSHVSSSSQVSSSPHVRGDAKGKSCFVTLSLSIEREPDREPVHTATHTHTGNHSRSLSSLADYIHTQPPAARQCRCHSSNEYVCVSHTRSAYAYVYVTTCSTSISMPHLKRRSRHICIPRTSLMSGLLSVSFSSNSLIIVFISCVHPCMRIHTWRQSGSQASPKGGVEADAFLNFRSILKNSGFCKWPSCVRLSFAEICYKIDLQITETCIYYTPKKRTYRRVPAAGLFILAFENFEHQASEIVRICMQPRSQR